LPHRPIPQYFRAGENTEGRPGEGARGDPPKNSRGQEWRDGNLGRGRQTRSFLFIDECIKGRLLLMRSGHTGPFHIGSEERIPINRLADLVMDIAGKKLPPMPPNSALSQG
jgi:nucleoside-diphosphate-sugar epimerase